ncbi:MAG TPA: hypothetical protein VM165_20110, partial [Planctomycetaceae bacterium]|nr:hypothetical protein [Planctomycetaceae bacterium]
MQKCRYDAQREFGVCHKALDVMLDGIREDLIGPLATIDAGRMLEFWRWLIPETYRPLFATALGDLFLAD